MFTCVSVNFPLRGARKKKRVTEYRITDQLVYQISSLWNIRVTLIIVAVAEGAHGNQISKRTI